ncbi:MAG TPA: amidohydrolase family protein, partial [Stellaceae bacterium]|nr:amidohydrolase family protein [Stellaceae bacterium]
FEKRGLMRIIAIEEHVTTPLYQQKQVDSPRRLASLADRKQRVGHDVMAEMLDMSNSRVAAMNDSGIDLQVLSMTMPGPQGLPAAEAIAVARDANDRIAAAVKAHPNRFAAFATLPTPDVKAAVAELQRTVGTLGFKGTMINGHTNGEFLDDKKYWPIFEAAEALDVPVYLHPRDVPPAAAFYFAGYPEIATAACGFTVDTTIHFMRLVFAGVFDAFPKLKFILGHLGEGIPFVLNRVEDHTGLAAKRRGLKRTFAEVMKESVWVTTSGNFSPPALRCTVEVLGIDRVMFSVDWPYESNKIGVAFLNNLGLAPPDLEKLAHGNAERLLRL